MLYDLGKRQNPIGGFIAFVVIFCGLIACVGVMCVMLSIAVAVGNLIIGW